MEITSAGFDEMAEENRESRMHTKMIVRLAQRDLCYRKTFASARDYSGICSVSRKIFICKGDCHHATIDGYDFGCNRDGNDGQQPSGFL